MESLPASGQENRDGRRRHRNAPPAAESAGSAASSSRLRALPGFEYNTFPLESSKPSERDRQLCRNAAWWLARLPGHRRPLLRRSTSPQIYQEWTRLTTAGSVLPVLAAAQRTTADGQLGVCCQDRLHKCRCCIHACANCRDWETLRLNCRQEDGSSVQSLERIPTANVLPTCCQGRLALAWAAAVEQCCHARQPVLHVCLMWLHALLPAGWCSHKGRARRAGRLEASHEGAWLPCATAWRQLSGHRPAAAASGSPCLLQAPRCRPVPLPGSCRRPSPRGACGCL